MRQSIFVALCASVVSLPALAAPVLSTSIVFNRAIGGVAEIPAIDVDNGRIFVANPTDLNTLKYYSTKDGALLGTLAPGILAGGQVNSVAVSKDKIAFAMQPAVKTDQGKIVVYDKNNLAAPPQIFDAGFLPDAITFSKDGKKILVANEGEPNSYNQPGSIDPVGSVTVVNVAAGTTAQVGFTSYIGQEAALRASGVRIYGPNANAAQDLEPEYVAVSPDGKRAFVTLQENNALAVIDLEADTPTVTNIVPLGFKNYGPGNPGIDPSDTDSLKANFGNFAGLYGMYQPDGITSFTSGGQTFYIMANEGDAREYPGYLGGLTSALEAEDRRVSAQIPGTPAPLSRLTVVRSLGATGPADGTLYTLGGRSFSIVDANGVQVFDSGNQLDAIVAADFNAQFDIGREDNKGTEPESVVVGRVDNRTLAFVGLERTIGTGIVLVFDITDFDPLSPNVPYLGAIALPGLVGPEGLSFVNKDSAGYLAVAGEVSGSLALIEINLVPAPAALALFGLGVLGLAAARRRTV